MKILSILVLLFFCSTAGFAQGYILDYRLSKIAGIKITERVNENFREFYEITISQPVDHSKPGGAKFKQRVYIGFQNFTSPVVFETDGYALRNNYNHELAKEFNANLVMVEHRYFGKSVPDSLDWRFLTVQQAAEDYHLIRHLLDSIFTGKWISTGVSKGGQAALAYKLAYPNDVATTVVYGTAVKNKPTINTDTLLYSLSKSVCGEKLAGLQLFAFKQKGQLLAEISKYKYDFNPLDLETAVDYMLLELPFLFWQNENSCSAIPDTTVAADSLAKYVAKIVPPRFFSSATQLKLPPSFYMFYHQLGYYEYDTRPFRPWLKDTDYSNKRFAPKNVMIEFDSSYQKASNTFLATPEAESVFFIYGEYDPWALQTVAKKNVFVVEGGSHKSRMADLAEEQKTKLIGRVGAYLK